MLGGLFRIAAVLAVAALLASAVVACGGDDDPSTTGASQNASGATAGSGSAPGEKGDPSGSGGGKTGGGGKSEQPGASGGSAPEDVEAAPLEVTGGGSEQFRVKGGDNSIQEYGEEDEDGLAAAAEAVHGFYVARAEKDWARACTYLAQSIIGQLQQLVASQGKDTECAAILEGLTPPLPASVRRESTIVDAGSLRHGDESSFLIYRGERGIVYAMPLEEEDGAWKLTLLSPTPLG